MFSGPQRAAGGGKAKRCIPAERRTEISDLQRQKMWVCETFVRNKTKSAVLCTPPANTNKEESATHRAAARGTHKHTDVYRVHAQQDQQRDGGEASSDPLLQGDGAVSVVVDLLHHLLQYLQSQIRIRHVAAHKHQEEPPTVDCSVQNQQNLLNVSEMMLR